MGQANHAHIPALDGVRGIAILLVICVHTGLMPGGRIGVDLFFVLSGFLITSILLSEFDRYGRVSIPRFYLRRALRLLPALFLVVAFVLMYAWAFQSPTILGYTLNDAWTIGLYYFNWHRVAQVIAGRNSEHQWMFSHLWSLSVEEQFYLIWPFVLLGILKSRVSARFTIAIFAIGIATPCIARILLWEPSHVLALYFRTDLRADGLMWGAFTAWLIRAYPERTKYLDGSWTGLAALIALLWIGCHDLLGNGSFNNWGFALVGFLSALLIAAAVRFPTPILRLSLESRLLRWIGRISYGVYLWHWPVMRIFAAFAMNEQMRIVGEIAATFLIASLSFYFYETPFLRLKQTLGSGRAANLQKPEPTGV